MINGGVGKRLEALQGAFSGDGGTDADDNAKALGDVISGKIGSFDRSGAGDLYDTILGGLKAIVGRQHSYSSSFCIPTTADMTSATWNTVAKHKILAVTAPMHVRMLAYCVVSIADAAGESRFAGVGPTGDTDKYLNTGGVPIVGPNIDTGEFIPVAGGADAPVKGDVTSNILADFFTTESIFYEISGAAFIDGTMLFMFWIDPILDDSLTFVAAGNGSAT